MKLIDYYAKNSKLYSEDAGSDRTFLHEIFHDEFGDNGLDYLQYKKIIHNSIHNIDYYIDFAIEKDGKKYAILIDKNSYGTESGTNEGLVQDDRYYEIINKGYKIFCYSCKHHYMYNFLFQLNLSENLPIPSVHNRPYTLQDLNREADSIRKKELHEQKKSKGCAFTILFILLSIFLYYVISSLSINTTQKITPTFTLISTTKPTNTLYRTAIPTRTPIPVQTPISTIAPKYHYGENTVTWNCVDSTSFDGNAYNDNKCISSTGEIRYVSDSQAIALDPSYWPGKSGDPYYNNK